MPFTPQQLLDKDYLKRAREADRPDKRASLRRRQAAAGRHGLPHRGRRLRNDGVDDPVELHGLRLGRGGAGHRHLAAEPRRHLRRCSEGHPNRVGPKKQPYQTIIPGFVTKDGKPVMSFGVMGGTMQPQGHAAGDGAHRRLRPEPAGGLRRPALPLGAGHGRQRRGQLPAGDRSRTCAARGHRIVTVDDYNQFGSGQMIWKLDGGYLAASDPRRDGQAAGLLRNRAMLKIWGRDEFGQREEGAVVRRGARACRYERIDAGMQYGVVNTPEYRKMNPNGLVPTDGRRRLHPVGVALHRALPVGESTARACSGRWTSARAPWPNQWMDWAFSFQGSVRDAFWNLIRTPAGQARRRRRSRPRA